MKTFFVCAGYYLNENRLKSSFVREMEKQGIKSVIVTTIFMIRHRLVTKEAMEKYCGERIRVYGYTDVNSYTYGELRHKSVNDDLESFFEDLCLENAPDWEADTYFFPKLNIEEMELVEKKDSDYLANYLYNLNADVDEDEMKLSESDSKFVKAICERRSFKIELN